MIEYEDNKEKIDQLLTRLKSKLRLRDLDIDFNDNDLIDEIICAIEAVNGRRNFVASSDRLFDEKYSSLIIRLCLYSIAKIGAEGETSHSENGINRRYENANDYPEDLLSQVKPLAKGVGN